MSKKYQYLSIFALCSTVLFSFQNCADFGTFVADYSQLYSTDPHVDTWRPVRGLEVKNGEWQAVEERVTHKARGTDRYFVSSVLYRAFLPEKESEWNKGGNKTVRNLIDTYVHKNYSDFGGPCFYTNPERKVGNVNIGCTGVSEIHMDNPVVPGSNAFRAGLKVRLCDRIVQSDQSLKNFEANAKTMASLLGTKDLMYAAHQLFYLGSDPRRRTYASLENIYDLAADKSGKEIDGLRHLAMVLCTSVGWETP